MFELSDPFRLPILADYEILCIRGSFELLFKAPKVNGASLTDIVRIRALCRTPGVYFSLGKPVIATYGV